MKFLSGTILFLFCATFTVHAQDTFYVKKKVPVPAQVRPAVFFADTTVKDSIVSYTAEFQRPGSNIFSRVHMKGPSLSIPPGSQGQRVLFTEIIAIDKNGRRYRMPDRIYFGGYTVPVEEPK